MTQDRDVTRAKLREGVFVTPEVIARNVDRLYDDYFGERSTYGDVARGEQGRYLVLEDLVERGLLTWQWEYDWLLVKFQEADADAVSTGEEEQLEATDEEIAAVAIKEAAALTSILGDLYAGRWLAYMSQIRQYFAEVEHDPGMVYATMGLGEWFEDMARWIHYGR